MALRCLLAVERLAGQRKTAPQQCSERQAQRDGTLWRAQGDLPFLLPMEKVRDSG